MKYFIFIWCTIMNIILVFCFFSILYCILTSNKKHRYYTMMSILTFWVVIILPLVNYLFNYSVPDYIIIVLLFLCMTVKVAIAIMRVESNLKGDIFSNKKFLWRNIIILSCFLYFYIDIGVLPLNMRFILFTPQLAYYGILCYYYRKNKE